MGTEIGNKVLFVQARTSPEKLAKERKMMSSLAMEAGFTARFANPLVEQHSDTTVFEHNLHPRILNEYGAVVFLGTDLMELSLARHVFIADASKRDHYLRSVVPLVEAALEHDVPTLGICLGHQLISAVAGGKIERVLEREETGTRLLHQLSEDPVFRGLQNPAKILTLHVDSVTKAPPGFIDIAETSELDGGTIVQHAMMRRGNIMTIQPHPELRDPVEIVTQVNSSHDSSLGEFPEPESLVLPDNTGIIVVNFLREAKAIVERRGSIYPIECC